MILVNKKNLEALADSFDVSVKAINDELTNVRKAPEMEIDRVELNKQIAGLRVVLDELFNLKEKK